MQANPDTGEVFATIEPGPRQNLIQVDQEKVEGLDERIFRRYYAFRLGDPYNSDFLDVSVRRVLDEGMVQSDFFLTRCEADGATAQQKFVVGPPRLFSAGVGVDTERLLFFRTSWKNSRLGRTGSLLNLVLAASFRDQEFDATSQWYFLREPSRFYLRPALSIRHDNLGPKDSPSETLTGKLQLAPALNWDTQDLGGSFYIGPTLNLTHTIQGPGPKFAQFLSMGSEWRITDHYYEFYRASPRTGFEVRLEGNSTQKDVLSSFSAHLFRLTFEKLWNVRNLDPPLFVVGLRGQLASTLTNQTVSSSTLTPEFRHFLGGSTNLRGFGLKELPGDASGALTGAYLGLELRFADVLPAGLQPFTFLDLGAMGRTPFELDRPYFWSPGMGLRWETSFGVLRSTLSHGYLAYNDVQAPEKLSHWQFYFSFGEEF
jgi:outer membrane translocation and assembly module TamA